MTHCAELTTCSPRASSIAARIKAGLARLLASRHRRLDRVHPERWSRHLLKDIGLAE